MPTTLQVTSAARTTRAQHGVDFCMDMTGERRIPAPRQIVWEALNNPEVLKASIPGCESLDKLSDTQMKATAAVKLGPISARFTGNVLLSEIDAPNSYRISGEGQGGVAGFAKGGAAVKLADDAADTLLSYQVNAQVGGKLAQLGARLIDASAKQMADAFFDRFSKQVQIMSPAGEAAQVATPSLVAAEASTAYPAAAQAAAPSAEAVRGVRPPPQAAPVDAKAGQPVAPAALVSPAAKVGPSGEPAGAATMAEPLAAAMSTATPPAAVSIWALIPREPFGLPLAAWVGGGIYVIMVLLMLGSMI